MSADVEVVFTPWPYDAVARGVALLDEKVPGWRERIALGRLNMDDPVRCIVGQLGIWHLVEEDTHHGFDIPLRAPTRDYATLCAAWREAIAGGV